MLNGVGMMGIIPGTSIPYDCDAAGRTARMILIDDGSETHKASGTKMGPLAFEQDSLKRIIGYADAIIVNAGPTDHCVGAMVASGAMVFGRTVLIDTEMPAWADWARLVFAEKRPDCFSTVRIPPNTIIPDDLKEKVDWSMERDAKNATCH